MSGSSNPFYDPPSGQPANPNAQNILTGEQQYLDRQPAPQTAAQTIGGFQQVQAQGIANQTAQQTLQAKQAIGQIMQGATNPDGTIDWGKAAVGVAGNPAASFLAPDFINTMIANQKVSADTARTLLANGIDHYTAVGGALAPLTAKGATIDQDDVRGVVGNLVGQGVLPKDDAMNLLSNMADGGEPLANQVKMYAQGAQQAATTLQQTYGTLGFQDIGGQEVPVATGALGNAPGGGPTGGVAIAKTPTPTELNASQDVTTNTGASVSEPSVMARPMVDGNGNIVNAGVKPSLTALAPEDQQILGPYQSQVNADAAAAVPALSNLQKMDNLENNFVSGKNSAARAQVAAQLQSVGAPPNVVAGAMNGDLSSYQMFQKYQLIAAAQALMQNSRGAISDGEFSSFKQNLLSSDMTPTALKDMTKQTIKLASLPVLHQKFLRGWLQNGGTPSDEPAAWTKAQQKLGIYNLGGLPSIPGADDSAPAANGAGSPEGTVPAGITP